MALWDLIFTWLGWVWYYFGSILSRQSTSFFVLDQKYLIFAIIHQKEFYFGFIFRGSYWNLSLYLNKDLELPNNNGIVKHVGTFKVVLKLHLVLCFYGDKSRMFQFESESFPTVSYFEQLVSSLLYHVKSEVPMRGDLTGESGSLHQLVGHRKLFLFLSVFLGL